MKWNRKIQFNNHIIQERQKMKKKQDEEPAWLNPENDRKTPYTDEEIEEFVDGFIEGFPEEYGELKKNDGPNTARVILRNRFKAMDENRKQ
jgi:hypothetical protein